MRFQFFPSVFVDGGRSGDPASLQGRCPFCNWRTSLIGLETLLDNPAGYTPVGTICWHFAGIYQHNDQRGLVALRPGRVYLIYVEFDDSNDDVLFLSATAGCVNPEYVSHYGAVSKILAALGHLRMHGNDTPIGQGKIQLLERMLERLREWYATGRMLTTKGESFVALSDLHGMLIDSTGKTELIKVGA